MEFNQKIGKEFFETQIGVKKNIGQGTDLMRNRYNQNLRKPPPDPVQVHQQRRIKLLERQLKEAKKK